MGEPAKGRRVAVGGDESGAAILEFALVLPILLVLLGAAFELGRVLLIRETTIGAVRNGASYLARVPDPSCDQSCAPGAAQAIATVRRQIAEDAGVPQASVTVSSRFDPAEQTVTLDADLRVGFALLRLAGLQPTITLAVTETERRIAE